MSEKSPERRNDLWMVAKAFDHGPEENLELWRGAKDFVNGLVTMTEQHPASSKWSNDALLVALADCFERIEEEVRRHEAELEMRREWAARQPTEADLNP